MSEVGSQARRWSPAVNGRVARRTLEVAEGVAARLTDRERLLAINQAALAQTHYPQIVHWDPFAVAQGDAGLALTCAALDACFPHEGWDVAGHDYLDYSVESLPDAGFLPPGLFSGLGGLAFAAHSLSRDGTRYQRLLATLDSTLSERACAQAAHLSGRHGVAVSEFDVVTGLSGVGVYLLCRRSLPLVHSTLRTVLKAMVDLTGESGGTPNWHTPAHLIADESMLDRYPLGNLNCGLAHGIPGPLAFMSLALSEGVSVDGLESAIGRTAEWIVRHQTRDAFGVNWPTVVPCLPEGTPPPEWLDSSRAAWCYGTPGVARALWLAGQALDDDDLRGLAIDGMAAVYRRPVSERRIDSPTFCHGVAGLLQVTLRFAHDTGEPVFREAAEALCEQLLAEYDPQRPLGFASIEPEGNRVDQPGLLDGAPGVILPMLAAVTDAPPKWDRLFLLS